MCNERFCVVGRARRLLEPKVGCNLPVCPKVVTHATDQRQSSCPGSSLTLGDDLFDETPVLGRVAVIQGWPFIDLTCGQPYKSLGPKEATGEVIVDLVWQTVGENFVQIGRDVRGSRVMMGRRVMVIALAA